jgi:hypothetical protein
MRSGFLEIGGHGQRHFLRVAIEEMVRIYELRELEERIWKNSLKIATTHPMSISDAVLSARAEEDDEL